MSKRLANQAAQAHSNLTVFHGVIALLEAGIVGESDQKDAIIKLCRVGARVELIKYDTAVASLTKENKHA